MSGTGQIIVSIVRAVIALPQSINAVKEMIKKGSNNKNILKELDNSEIAFSQLKTSLTEFCERGKFIREAKKLHDLATNIDLSIAEAFNETIKARSTGKFDPTNLNLSVVRKSWERTRNASLNELISFSELLTEIDIPLKKSIAGEFITGPSWAKIILESNDLIIKSFKSIDGGDMNSIYTLSHDMDVFSSKIKEIMSIANAMIRKSASDLVDDLSQIKGALRND